MTVDGASYLVIDHTDALDLGKDNGDFTVSFALLQTQEQGDWRNLIHKGNSNGERTPAIWKHYGNTGFHARISTTANGNEGISNSPAVELNRWYYLTYLKQGQSLRIYYDGVQVEAVHLQG